MVGGQPYDIDGEMFQGLGHMVWCGDMWSRWWEGVGAYDGEGGMC